MRDDLIRVTLSSTVAQLRRAMMLRHATTPPRSGAVMPRSRAPAREVARRADLDASRSLTERHLQVLGVGRPPDRAELEDSGARW